MESDNKTIYYVVGGLLVIGILVYFFQNSAGSSMTTTTTPDQVTTTTDTGMMATETDTTADANGSMTASGGAKVIPGYPSSWPSDVPKYPVNKVDYAGAHNIGSIKVQNAVVFDTTGAVQNVRSFYLTGLANNGWTITETGNGLANLISLKAVKGKRTVIVYINRTGASTNVTVGVNIGV